jgi:CpeS-like protein
MVSTIQLHPIDQLIEQFFARSVGQWSSERRYYTLPDGKTKEMVSDIKIRFLAVGCEELQHLAQLHGLAATALVCGVEVSWDSQNSILGKQMAAGTTLFGVLDGVLYRDRGFATTKPVTASLAFPNPETMCLRTEYNGSVFEEEVRLVGEKYRTRQTVISRAGEQIMIGQYLEKRVA